MILWTVYKTDLTIKEELPLMEEGNRLNMNVTEFQVCAVKLFTVVATTIITTATSPFGNKYFLNCSDSQPGVQENPTHEALIGLIGCVLIP